MGTEHSYIGTMYLHKKPSVLLDVKVTDICEKDCREKTSSFGEVATKKGSYSYETDENSTIHNVRKHLVSVENEF